jgi:hypothetical protein
MRQKNLLPALMLITALGFAGINARAQQVEVSKSHKASKHKDKPAAQKSSSANNNGGEGPFQEGTLEVDLGIGYGSNYNYNYWNGWYWDGWRGRYHNSAFLPSLYLALDYGVKKAGPGTFGLGGALTVNTAYWSLSTPSDPAIIDSYFNWWYFYW